MGMTTIYGTVSGLRERTDVLGNRNEVRTQRSVHLRIGNRAAFIKSSPNLADGDIVTAAGLDGAEFHIIAIRNESTGVLYWEVNPLHAIIGGSVVILLSPIFFLLIFPPFILIPLGGWMIWKGIQAKNAEKLLRATPVQTPTA
jgi:hypothetical protein